MTTSIKIILPHTIVRMDVMYVRITKHSCDETVPGDEIFALQALRQTNDCD